MEFGIITKSRLSKSNFGIFSSFFWSFHHFPNKHHFPAPNKDCHAFCLFMDLPVMKMLYKWNYKIPGLSLNVVFFLLGPYNLWPGFTPLCGWAILCCAYIWPHLSIQLPYDIIDICIFIFWSLCPVRLWIIIHKLLLKFIFFQFFQRDTQKCYFCLTLRNRKTVNF